MAIMSVKESPAAKNIPFEDIRAILREITQKNKEIDLVIDRVSQNIDRISKKNEETAAQLVENSQQIKKNEVLVEQNAAFIAKLSLKVDRVTSNVGGLNQSLGDLIETLFAPHLGEKFDAYHYNLKRMFRRVPIYDHTNRLRSDIDILLSDTTVCMAVEVKRWLERLEHVDEQIRRMELIRQYPPAEVKGKKLLGAIVGAVVTPEAREYAEQNGFFVLELTGEDVHLLQPPQGFSPKEW